MSVVRDICTIEGPRGRVTMTPSMGTWGVTGVKVVAGRIVGVVMRRRGSVVGGYMDVSCLIVIQPGKQMKRFLVKMIWMWRVMRVMVIRRHLRMKQSWLRMVSMTMIEL